MPYLEQQPDRIETAPPKDAVVECVPNFSEGRDPVVVEMIVQAMREATGASVLAWEWDEDHNRSVVTIAGSPAGVVEAAVRGVREAVKHIDLRKHQGVHPRIGAADVVPFIPIDKITLDQCAAVARQAGERIWEEVGVPVYFYGAAAQAPGRVALANIRRGGFEGLARESLTNKDRQPDVGGPALHASAGATVVGARRFLLAFNVNLKTGDVAVADSIAREIRESSGGLKEVRALGVPLASRSLSQITINLSDYTITGLEQVYDAVERAAADRGVEILSSEVIGLYPRDALPKDPVQRLKLANFSENRILETRMGALLGAASAGSPGGH